MMKRVFAFILTLLMVTMLFAGCSCKHQWEEATCEDPKTCEKCGETEGGKEEHDWKEANCETPKKCRNCRKTSGKALGHNWQNDVCTRCNKPEASLADVLSAGKIVVAISPDFPPFESLENGNVVGIEVDIMNRIAQELGVTVEYVQKDFDEVLSATQVGTYDMAVSGITITAGRQKNFLFTTPYFSAAEVIVVKEGSAIKTKADLKDKTVSVQCGTTAEMVCQDEEIKHNAFNANADAKAALTTGKVDAWVVDNLTAQQMVTADDGLVILQERMYSEDYAFVLPKSSTSLANRINEIIERLIADGFVAATFEKYGEMYIAPASSEPQGVFIFPERWYFA